MTDMDIDTLISIERFLPVLAKEEQDALVIASPTLQQLQEWQHRLDLRTERIDGIFRRAFGKQNHRYR